MGTQAGLQKYQCGKKERSKHSNTRNKTDELTRDGTDKGCISFLLFVTSSLELEVDPVCRLAGHPRALICAAMIEDRGAISEER